MSVYIVVASRLQHGSHELLSIFWIVGAMLRAERVL